MPYTDDPVADFEAHDVECRKWLEKRPVCNHCGEHIQDEYAYYIDDAWVCDDCIKQYRKVVESNGS